MFSVKETRREAPVRVVFHGPGGVGKSTIASQAPDCIFIAAEEGLENIEAKAVEPYPRTWEEVLAAIEFVGTLRHQTLAIDSLDWLEPLCWDFVCRKARKPDIEAFGYGKGYVAALDQWRVLLSKLSMLRVKGMNVILIAHSVRKNFKNPTGDDFEHWTIKLHEKASGLIKEWVDVVGFCTHEVSTVESNGRTKGLSTGKRVIHTQPSAAYEAKTRYAMPKSIPLDWGAFAQAVRDGGPAAVERMKGEFEAKIRELGNEDVELGARSFLRSRGETVPTLSEAIATLDTYLNEKRAS